MNIHEAYRGSVETVSVQKLIKNHRYHVDNIVLRQRRRRRQHHQQRRRKPDQHQKTIYTPPSICMCRREWGWVLSHI